MRRNKRAIRLNPHRAELAMIQNRAFRPEDSNALTMSPDRQQRNAALQFCELGEPFNGWLHDCETSGFLTLAGTAARSFAYEQLLST
jgi:hypothetical protein